MQGLCKQRCKLISRRKSRNSGQLRNVAPWLQWQNEKTGAQYTCSMQEEMQLDI